MGFFFHEADGSQFLRVGLQLRGSVVAVENWVMAGGKARGVSGGSSKKKKKGKPLSKDPARLAAVHATLSRWASVNGRASELSLPRMDLHTHSTCSKFNSSSHQLDSC